MHSERLAYIEKLNREEELSREDVQSLIDEVKRLRQVLREVNHTLCIHGHIDQETPLHELVHLAVADAL